MTTDVSNVERSWCQLPSPPAVILASASRSRQEMLLNAGLDFEIEAARLDEGEVKAALRAEGADGARAAETLAELKAQRVSAHHRAGLVIGADQILDCDGRWFDKPSDRDQAASHLRALSGRTHTLVSGACVVRDGQRIWHHSDQARMTMRPLGDDFIEAYLSKLGEVAFSSVGAYQLEGLGAQLFSRVEGDFFTILGLPLLPLLEFLRNHRVLAI